MNDNYDRAPAALGAEISRGLTQSGFINRVFGWMTAGLAVTGAISYGISSFPVFLNCSRESREVPEFIVPTLIEKNTNFFG